MAGEVNLAMMLPPFVPPSARGNREALPSITEFVSGIPEQSFSKTGTARPRNQPRSEQSFKAKESLPLITDFLLTSRESSAAGQEGHGFDSEWLEDERNAFDWKSVSVLAVKHNEERRAAEDWTATSWETSGSSTADHVAMMLMQVARRVRGGELHVEATQGMSVEAILAATLTALLQADR
jgi:hypothetical protein